MDDQWPHPRKNVREPAHYKVAVKRDHGYLSVLPADVSAFGIGLILPWEAVIGDPIELVVTTGNKIYHCPGVVKWVAPDGDGRTRVGVELTPDNTGDAEAVYAAIR